MALVDDWPPELVAWTHDLLAQVILGWQSRGVPPPSAPATQVAELFAALREQRHDNAIASASGTRRRQVPAPSSEWLSTAAVAGLLGVSERWVRQLAAGGAFEGAGRCGRAWVITTASVEAYRAAERRRGAA